MGWRVRDFLICVGMTAVRAAPPSLQSMGVTTRFRGLAVGGDGAILGSVWTRPRAILSVAGGDFGAASFRRWGYVVFSGMAGCPWAPAAMFGMPAGLARGALCRMPGRARGTSRENWFRSHRPLGQERGWIGRHAHDDVACPDVHRVRGEHRSSAAHRRRSTRRLSCCRALQQQMGDSFGGGGSRASHIHDGRVFACARPRHSRR
jgi:hypothetical protein